MAQRYTTDLDVSTGGVHLELTDAEMVEWIKGNVHGPLVTQILDLMSEHGAQQVLIAAGIASTIELWRREHPEQWEAAQRRSTRD